MSLSPQAVWRALGWPRKEVRLLVARSSRLQLLVMAAASVSPLVIVGVLAGRWLGLATTEQMVDVALGAGENPGMVTFGMMFLASPVQWWTGRSQIRVRKYLGIVFFFLAASNGTMFVIEEGAQHIFDELFLIAGSAALLTSVPLFVTSTRWAQRQLGMKRWRSLHRLTYVVAVLLLTHVVLIGDLGLGSLLILIGLICRVPAVRSKLKARPNKTRPDDQKVLSTVGGLEALRQRDFANSG